MKIGARIREWREQAGWKQADVKDELAKVGVDISLSGYRSYETGRTRIPPHVIDGIAAVYKKEPGEVRFGTIDTPKGSDHAKHSYVQTLIESNKFLAQKNSIPEELLKRIIDDLDFLYREDMDRFKACKRKISENVEDSIVEKDKQN